MENRAMNRVSFRKSRPLSAYPTQDTDKSAVRQRIFAVRRRHESEDERMKADAERAIRRVLAEWGEHENSRLKKIPTAVEELVRFYCLDYERRQKALDTQNSTDKQAAIGMQSGVAVGAEKDFLNDNQTLHTNLSPRESKRYGSIDGKRNLTLRVARKREGMSAPLASSYRRLNALIDLSLELSCDEGVRATMRHDIATRRGDRRTTLYYLDRRAYLRQKRHAKLAIAAALGLL